MVSWLVSFAALAGPLEDRFAAAVDANPGTQVVVCGPVRKAPPHTWLADHAGWTALWATVHSDALHRSVADPTWERLADDYRRTMGGEGFHDALARASHAWSRSDPFLVSVRTVDAADVRVPLVASTDPTIGDVPTLRGLRSDLFTEWDGDRLAAPTASWVVTRAPDHVRITSGGIAPMDGTVARFAPPKGFRASCLAQAAPGAASVGFALAADGERVYAVQAPSDAPAWTLGPPPATRERPDVVEAWVVPESATEAEARDRWSDPPQLPSHQGVMRGGLANQSDSAWGVLGHAPIRRHARATFAPPRDARGARRAEVYLFDPIDVDAAWASLQGRSLTDGPRLTLGSVKVDVLPAGGSDEEHEGLRKMIEAMAGISGASVRWLDPARTEFEVVTASGWHAERLGGWIALARDASHLDRVAPGKAAWWRDGSLIYWLHDATPDTAPEIGWSREVRATAADGIWTFRVLGMARHAL